MSVSFRQTTSVWSVCQMQIKFHHNYIREEEEVNPLLIYLTKRCFSEIFAIY